MTLCKYYLQGNCKFGDGCRFEHRAPKPHEPEFNEWRRNNPSSFGGQQTAFGTTGNSDSHATRKGWSEQIIYDNLKSERPQWPFTSFGAPYFHSLLQNDVSFEEFRSAAVEANRSGTFPGWQRSIDQRIAEIKRQEENVLSNLKQAWQYNTNEPYYPTGKPGQSNTGSAFGNVQTSTFGGTAFGGSSGSGSAFGTGTGTGTWGLGGASAFSSPGTSFGASPFGAMPASAFSLGSRDVASTNLLSTSATTTPAFGSGTTTAVFGQPRSAFGSTSAPSTFGSITTSTLGAKPSVFGTSTTGLPPAPMSSSLTASTPAFGQTSTLGVSGLPPPPGAAFTSKPTFGQTSQLGVLGTSTPTFGQTSTFSSPFAGGLGKALSGGASSTFGSKPVFGSFAQAANQPSAFATAATSGTNGFGAGNRFTLLSETTGNGGDKDADMAVDQTSPIQERPTVPSAPAGPPTPPAAKMTSPFVPTAASGQTAQIPPTPQSTTMLSPSVPTSSTIASQTAQAVPASARLASSAADLSTTFGSLSTRSEKESQPAARAQVVPEKPAVAANITPMPASTQPTLSSGMSNVNETEAWRAMNFTIGGIPETEPPLEVR